MKGIGILRGTPIRIPNHQPKPPLLDSKECYAVCMAGGLDLVGILKRCENRDDDVVVDDGVRRDFFPPRRVWPKRLWLSGK